MGYSGGAYMSEFSSYSDAPLSAAYNKLDKALEPFKSRVRSAVSKMRRAGRLSDEKAVYWNSNHEVFARSFEKHIQHKLREAGRENTYLSGIDTDGRADGELWPTPEEAAAHAAAFDAIFEAYKKHGPHQPQKYAKRRQPLRYAVRHAPKGGVSIKGKQFSGGQFIPEGDYEQADPETKAAIDGQTTKNGESSEHRIGAMDVGAKITDPEGVEWEHKGKGTWQDAGGVVSRGRGYYPGGVMSRFGNDHAKIHEAIDAWHASQPKQAEQPAPSQPEASATPAAPQGESTPQQKIAAKEAVWTKKDIDWTNNMIADLEAAGANRSVAGMPGGSSPHAKDYIRRVNELKALTAKYNEEYRASGATSEEHLQEIANPKAAPTTPTPAPAPAPTPPASQPTVTAPPDPNAGSGDLAGTLGAAPKGTKVGDWTKNDGDKWVHKLGSVFNTAQMIGHTVNKGQGDALNQAVDALKNPAPPPPGKQPKQPKPGQPPKPPKQPSHPKGRINPATMTADDRKGLSTIASIYGINAGDSKNLDRAANFALLAARKLGLNPQGADKTAQAGHAARFLAAQQPKLDALIDTAAKLGHKGKAQSLVHRYKAAGEHIVKAAAAAGYKNTGKFDKADIMGALQHLSTVKAPSITPPDPNAQQPASGPLPLPAGPGGVRPGQNSPDALQARRDAAKATPGATRRPPSTFGPKPDGSDAKPSISQIIDALATKVGGRSNLAMAVGVLAALWAAYAHQQRRQFYRQGTASGYNVIRYAE